MKETSEDIPENAADAGPAEEPSPGIALHHDSLEIQEHEYAVILMTVSPLAADWVAENLDSVWTAGERYELNAGEYQALKEVLSASGAAFSETAGPADSEGFLLVASEDE